MARTAKKEKALTPEEKLAQALVLDVEQPYRVPENWCWVVQGQVSAFCNGRAYKQAELLEDETKTPVLRVGNLFTNISWYYSDLKLDENKYIDNEDLIYAWSASFGPFIWRGGRAIYHYHIWKVELTSALKKEFYYYWLLNDTERLKKQGHGTGMIHVTKEMMENTAMPLPPLAEQQRIVDRIESLFAKLDEAKEKAQAVVDSFEDRRAAILHKAFTGELTAAWREKNKITFSSWVKVKMQDVCEKITCGKTPKEHIATEGEVPFLKVYNIVNNKVDFETTPQYIPLAIHKGRLYSSILKPNDVIMNIVGPPLRKIAIIPNTYKEWNMNQAIVRFRPKEGLDYRYLYYSLVNPETLDDVIRATKGVVGQANISVSQSRNLEIMLPSMEEQQEVVRLLDMLIEKVQKAKEAAEQVIDQIDSMKKSILARAFRGELGTNDPAEESAEELLKRVLCDDVPAPQRAKPVTIPKELSKSLRNDMEKKIIKLYFQRDTTALSVKEIMSVSSKTFEVLDCLRSLQNRQIITKQEDGNYRLMG